MAKVVAGGGSDDDDSTTDSTGSRGDIVDDSNSSGSTLTIPWSWLTGLPEKIGNLPELGESAINLLENPKRFIRGVFVGWIIGGIAAIVKPVFAAIELLFLGSAPAQFGAPGETWGLVDLPVVIARLGGNTFGWVITTLYGTVASLIAAVIPQVPGPVEGIIATAVIVALAVVVARVGFPILLVGLEAIPVIGGPLATLLEELQ